MTKSIALLHLILSASAFAEFDETLIRPPLKESNEIILYAGGCRTRSHERWDMCYSIDRNNIYTPRNFKLDNRGGNESVPNSGFYVSRTFEFKFEDMARSDMSLMIWDSPDDTESHGHLKLMTFFPRDIMPAIRYESDDNKDVVIVTLPTREEVIFNGKTREIISGALSEGPMRQTSNGAAVSPDIQYEGTGVVVEASALASWPVGFEGEASAKYVTIKKKGQKTCSVLGKDLWYTDRNKGGNVFFNKKLYSNEAFNSYVKKNCGFSIY
jgi:hypothetical protein